MIFIHIDSNSFTDSTCTTVAGGDPQSWARRRKRHLNKHKQNNKFNKLSHGPSLSQLRSLDELKEEARRKEIELRLTPLDREQIQKAKAQGIKVNLSTAKRVPRYNRTKKESPWQLSKNEFSMKKPSKISVSPRSSSPLDEIDPLTKDSMLSKLDQNLLETEDILRDEMMSTPQPDDSNKDKDKLSEKSHSLEEDDGKINSLPESDLNPEKKNDTYELSYFLNRKPNVISESKKFERFSTNKIGLSSNALGSGVGIERLSSPSQNSQKSLKDEERYNILDVTVEELDNALLKELPQTNKGQNPPESFIEDKKDIELNTPCNFSSEVRIMESKIHEMVSNTARVALTSSNLDLNMAKNMLRKLKFETGHFYDTAILTKDIKRILLSYFYFVRLKDEKSRQELQGIIFTIDLTTKIF